MVFLATSWASSQTERRSVEDGKTISYQFTLDGQRRIVSYHFDGDTSVRMGVREQPGGAPFIQLLATRGGIRARTPEGEFTLVRGKWVLPPSTDRRSVWLLAQDVAKNATLTPVVLHDRFWDARRPPDGPDEEVQESSSWGPTIVGVPGMLWSLYKIWEWLGGEDCLNPNQRTQCTETDVAGKETVVTFTCECGSPMCNQTAIPVDVAVAVVDASGNISTETQTRTIVVCNCYCLELEFNPGRPG